MFFDLLGVAMLDGQIAEVFRSPFIIPVSGCAMILGIVASGSWAKVRSEEIKSHERLARIAHGLPVEPNWEEPTVQAAKAAAVNEDPPGFQGYVKLKQFQQNQKWSDDGGKARRAGVVLTSIGLGLFVFFALLAATLEVRAVFCGAVAGVLPLAIGIGLLVDAQHKKDAYERRVAAGWYPMPGAVTGGQQPISETAPPPPPPPVGMTAAQASDWRPLH